MPWLPAQVTAPTSPALAQPAGRVTEAEQVFRDDLARNPRNPRSLFGLMNSLKAQARDADAAWVEREFNESWKGADFKLKLSDL